MDQVRFADEIPYPDGTRSLVWLTDNAQTELELRSLVYVTGWANHVATLARQTR